MKRKIFGVLLTTLLLVPVMLESCSFGGAKSTVAYDDNVNLSELTAVLCGGADDVEVESFIGTVTVDPSVAMFTMYDQLAFMTENGDFVRFSNEDDYSKLCFPTDMIERCWARYWMNKAADVAKEKYGEDVGRDPRDWSDVALYLNWKNENPELFAELTKLFKSDFHKVSSAVLLFVDGRKDEIDDAELLGLIQRTYDDSDSERKGFYFRGDSVDSKSYVFNIYVHPMRYTFEKKFRKASSVGSEVVGENGLVTISGDKIPADALVVDDTHLLDENGM